MQVYMHIYVYICIIFLQKQLSDYIIIYSIHDIK